MTPHRAASLLALCAAFQGAAVGDLRELTALAHFRTLRRGELLFSQGNQACQLYIVETGWLKVSRLGVRGEREVTLHLSGPRQLPAGVSPFQEGAVLSADCTALEPTSVLVLPAEAVRQIACHSPALARSVMSYMARRHSDLLQRLNDLLFTDLSTRLAQLLLERARSGPYPLPRNSELAAQLGTVPELVSRKLGEFYRQGFIVLERRTVRIVNIEALRQLSRP